MRRKEWHDGSFDLRLQRGSQARLRGIEEARGVITRKQQEIFRDFVNFLQDTHPDLQSTKTRSSQEPNGEPLQALNRDEERKINAGSGDVFQAPRKRRESWRIAAGIALPLVAAGSVIMGAKAANSEPQPAALTQEQLNQLGATKVVASQNAPDGKNRVTGLAADEYILPGAVFFAGENNSANNLELKQGGLNAPDYPFDLAVSSVNPRQAVVIGYRSENPDLGRIWVTNNGGESYEKIDHTSGKLLNVQYTDDGKLAIMLGVRATDYYISEYYAFDPATKTTRKLNLTPGNIATTLETPFRKLADGSLRGYGKSIQYRGYFEITIKPDGTMTTKQIKEELGLTSGGMYEFIDNNGEKNVMLLSNSTVQGDKTVGTVYLNKYAADGTISTVSVQPTKEKYSLSEYYGLVVGSLVADPKKDMGIMAVVVETYLPSYKWQPYIEIFSLSDPNNKDKRTVLPVDGDWPKGGEYTGDAFSSIAVYEYNGEKYLVVGLKNSTNKAENGVYIRRITNGITAADLWKKVPIAKTDVATSTPTATATGTATPRSATATATSTVEASRTPTATPDTSTLPTVGPTQQITLPKRVFLSAIANQYQPQK